MLNTVIPQTTHIKDDILQPRISEEAEDDPPAVVCPTLVLATLPTVPGATNGVLSNNKVCTNGCVAV